MNTRGPLPLKQHTPWCREASLVYHQQIRRWLPIIGHCPECGASAVVAGPDSGRFAGR